MQPDLTVAKTILEQLGGNRFIRMTGAKNLAGDESSLYFSIDGRSPEGKRINRFKITLAPSDTYTLEGFYSTVQRIDSVPVVSSEDIYCDALEEVFTRLTGLYTSLSRRR